MDNYNEKTVTVELTFSDIEFLKKAIDIAVNTKNKVKFSGLTNDEMIRNKQIADIYAYEQKKFHQLMNKLKNIKY